MTRTHRMDRRRLLLGVVVGALLAGCATVPEDSDVQVVRAAPAGPELPPPAGPVPGVDPFRLVSDFRQASVNPVNGHAAARAYLTREAAENWDDGASITVIEDAPQAIPEESTEPDTSLVRLRAQRIGTLAPDGSFTPRAGEVTVQIEMVRENGEWRITRPPPGVLVEGTDFQQVYQQASVAFIDPSRSTLVPDVRWFPVAPAETRSARVLDMLLDGPAEALSGAVISAIPRGARPRSNVLANTGGRTVIDLTGIGDIGEQERRLAAAQIVHTFEGMLTGPLRLLADGEPLVPGKAEWTPADITAFISQPAPRPDVPGLVAYEGLLRGLDGNPVAGPDGSGELRVLRAAQSSPSAQRTATVVAADDGSPELMVRSNDQGYQHVPLQANSMTRPTWRPSGNEVWTVLDGRTVAGVALSDDGTPTVYQVNASELAELGNITELRLSREGGRVAAIVNGRLVVGAVVTENGQVSISRPRLLWANKLPPSASVDWAGAELLLVASATALPDMSLVSVDGLIRQEVPTTNLAGPLTGVVAAPGRDPLVADATGLWTYSASQQVWEPVLGGIGPGAVPIYPG